MGIKQFETRFSLVKKLRERGLDFEEDELKEILIKYNYFNLFNGIESLLLSSKKPKRFNGIKLKDFLNIYNFDKKLNAIILIKLNYVEQRLKNSISYHFANQYCNTITDTMQYTNKNNFMNPIDSDERSNTYCRYSEIYPFVSEQNYNIYYNFNNFTLFKPYFLTNLINKNDHIEEQFYQDSSYVAPRDVVKYRDANGDDNTSVAVPFWVAIETLTFGETVRLLHYLQDSVLTNVMHDFSLKISKRDVFLNMLDFLLCLRNSCAHTSLVNRFRTPRRYCINALLNNVFKLNPKYTGEKKSVLKLYDVLKILSYFVDLSELKNMIRIMLIKNLFSLGFTKGAKINKLILDRMGCSQYNSWMRMLSREKYCL